MNIKLIYAVGFLFLLSTPSIAQFEYESEEHFIKLRSYDAISISTSCPNHLDRCNGKIVWEDGVYYQGEIRNKQIDGRGKVTYPNRYEYRGEFKDDLPHGNGKIIFENGTEYDGEWQFGKKEGFGAFRLPSGNEYLGNFKNDRMHGEGVMTLSKTEFFSGVWKNGKREGLGTHTRTDGSQFTGMYQEGVKNGKGMVTWNSGDTLHGVWKEGVLDNESQFKFADGSMIIQFWENGKLKDKMIFVQKSGLRFAATAKELNQLVVNSSLAQKESTESNFSLAYYSAALEYREMQNYEGASQQLEFAQFFQTPFDDSQIAEWIDKEYEMISLEKEKLGVAKKEDEKNE